MRRHPSPDFGLFADDHALQDPWVPEPDRLGNLSVQWCEGRFAELGGEFVEVVSDFVDGAVFGFRQFAGGGKGVFFEEEADFVAASEEVIVADVRGFFPGGEFGHGVVGEGKGGEHVVCFREECGDGGGVKGVGDEEVAMFFEGGELLGGELCWCGPAFQWRRYAWWRHPET